jgi:hypothetical protein
MDTPGVVGGINMHLKVTWWWQCATYLSASQSLEFDLSLNLLLPVPTATDGLKNPSNPLHGCGFSMGS